MPFRFHPLIGPALILSVALGLATSLAADADEPAARLTPHEASYKVKLGVVGGRLRTQLDVSANGLMATHAIEPTGVSRMFTRGRIEETSVFSQGDDALQPVRYTSSDSLSRDGTQVDMRFDWQHDIASGTIDSEDFELPLDALLHDRISIQYQLMQDLLVGEPRDTYQLFDGDEVKTVSVSVIETREVKTPAGRFEVTGIRHQTVGSKRVTTLWCAEALGYLPVVIEQHRLGKLRVRATLQDYVPNRSDLD